jgi:phosphatidylglycerophosphatase C
MLIGEDRAAAAGPEAAVGPRTVLFDFDGVLIHGDAFYLFMRHRYGSPWRKLLALFALPWLLLQLPLSRRWVMRSLVHVGLLGLNERRYRAVVERFADQLARKPRQFCRDGLRALRLHQAAGDRVIVVTGCEQVLVSRLLAQLGLSGVEIVASQLGPGWLGMRVRHHNIGVQKVQALRAHGVEAWQLAYGDSRHDIPMLRAATEAVLVNGTPKLCKRVEKALGRSTTRVAWY